MSFRASLLIGDKKGRVGLGVAKGADVQLAVEKAYRQAKKRLVRVPLLNGTIPHVVLHKFGAAQVLLKPAPVGTGLKCGGAVRVVMELAGVPTVEAIEKLRISERLQSSSTKTTPAPAASTLQVVPEEKKTIRKKTPVASKPKTTTRAPKKASSKTEDAA